MSARIAGCMVLALLNGLGFCRAAEITGEVVGVHDGDTIKVRVVNSPQLKVRLEGIDAPEAKQAFGSASKAQL